MHTEDCVVASLDLLDTLLERKNNATPDTDLIFKVRLLIPCG
jgi:hypothetical protein